MHPESKGGSPDMARKSHVQVCGLTGVLKDGDLGLHDTQL